MNNYSRIISLLLLILVKPYFSPAQVDSSYSKFILFRSQAIDYFPVWGKTDDELYFNLSSKEWRKIDIKKCNYIEGTYHEYLLGINTAENWVTITDKTLIGKLEKDKNWAPREVKNKNGIVFLLEQTGFNTQLNFVDKEGKKNKIMDIKGNAHSLSISPHGKYLACIFELSGLVIFDIEKEVKIGHNEIKVATINNLERAELYYRQGDFLSMKNAILKCTQDEKSTNSYHYYAGLIHFVHADSTQDTEAATIAIDHFLKIQDDARFYDSNIILSMMYALKNDWENTLKFAERTILLLPDRPVGY